MIHVVGLAIPMLQDLVGDMTMVNLPLLQGLGVNLPMRQDRAVDPP